VLGGQPFKNTPNTAPVCISHPLLGLSWAVLTLSGLLINPPNH
jgi:hypothetical protein